MVQYGTTSAQEAACEHGSDTPYHIVKTRFTEYYGTAWDDVRDHTVVLEQKSPLTSHQGTGAPACGSLAPSHDASASETSATLPSPKSRRRPRMTRR